jgi:mgtE-like transporter
LKFVSSTSDFIVRNRSVFIMGLAALIIAGTADLFAGLLLDRMEEYLLMIPGMMILIYSAIGMRGNIFGAMGSRIGTSMHMGTFQMNFKKGGVLRANIESTMCLTLILSAAMGFVTWAVAKYFFNGSYSAWDFIFISSFGGLLAGVLVLMFNILIAKEGYKRDWDVDNITAPLIAAIGDIITMPMIFLSTMLFLSILDFQKGEFVIIVSSIIFIVVTVIYTLRIILREINKRDFSGEAKRIILNSVPILLFCLIFEIGAGMVIQNEEENLFEYSVLLIMLPSFLNQGNALSGMLTSRLSSMIHLGTLETKTIPPKAAWENFNIMYICAMITFFYIGIMAYLATCAFSGGSDNMSIWIALLIILLAGFLATTLLNFLSYYVAILATRFGLDPDDHCIPITSSLMDMLGSIILVGVILLFI